MPRPKSMSDGDNDPGADFQQGLSKELAKANEKMGLDEMLRIIRGVDELTTISSEDIEEAMLERMLQAESWEELVTPQQVVAAKTMLTKKLTFHGAHLMNSSFVEGPKVYMIIDTEHDGKRFPMSCGSKNVMTILAIALHKEWLPADGVILESPKATEAGNKPLNLVWAPADDEPF